MDEDADTRAHILADFPTQESRLVLLNRLMGPHGLKVEADTVFAGRFIVRSSSTGSTVALGHTADEMLKWYGELDEGEVVA